MKTVDIGRLGEKKAAHFLRNNGYRIVAKNIHISHNEIDIIAKNKDYIVFVEVKARSTDKDLSYDFVTPAGAVDRKKQQRTIAAARTYLATCKYNALQPRFDVIEVHLDKTDKSVIHINHITNAFGA
jgi:putative endonuclease